MLSQVLKDMYLSVVKRRERHPQMRAQPERRLRLEHAGELPVVKTFGKMDETRKVMEPTREGLSSRSKSLD